MSELNLKWEVIESSSTIDPKVFGPPIWFTIHNVSGLYPSSPSPILKERMKGFIKSIPYLIPCQECFLHAQNYISKYDERGLDEIVSCGKKFFEWGVDFHNYVNVRIGKKIYEYEEAYNHIHRANKIKVLKMS